MQFSSSPAVSEQARCNREHQLLAACQNGDLRTVVALLRYGTDPNVRESTQHCSALHYAAHGNFAEIAMSLISSGARMDARMTTGQTPLDLAGPVLKAQLQQVSLSQVTPVQASARRAVVLCNEYQHDRRFKSAPWSAAAHQLIPPRLNELGFQTAALFDATKQEAVQRLKATVDSCQPGDVFLLWCSGHGGQSGADQFFLPTNVTSSNVKDLLNIRAFFNTLIKQPGRKAGINILILDFCRCDLASCGFPLAPPSKPSTPFPDPSAVPSSSAQTVLIFSCDPGGPGWATTDRSQPAFLSRAVLEHMKKGSSLHAIIPLIQNTCMALAHRHGCHQTCWHESSLRDKLFL